MLDPPERLANYAQTMQLNTDYADIRIHDRYHYRFALLLACCSGWGSRLADAAYVSENGAVLDENGKASHDEDGAF